MGLGTGKAAGFGNAEMKKKQKTEVVGRKKELVLPLQFPRCTAEKRAFVSSTINKSFYNLQVSSDSSGLRGEGSRV